MTIGATIITPFDPDASRLPDADLRTAIGIAGVRMLLELGKRERRRVLADVLADEADARAADELLQREAAALTAWPA